VALATVLSRAQNGLAAEPVRVEVHLAPGLPGLNLVGLPEAAVREAKDRVKAALVSCGYQFPNRRITCNLAPADLPKDSGRFDLAIALGILAASQQVPAERLEGFEVLGELSLSGAVQPVQGALSAALRAQQAGHRLILPSANLTEASLAEEAQLVPAHHLGALCTALHEGELAPARSAAPPVWGTSEADLAEVRGQPAAKRALEVAAAGGHSLLMLGPPGSGKSMLAQRLAGILPPMTAAESLEAAEIASITPGGFDARKWGVRSFRAPHHTASGVALVGGGSNPRPGEITLAHHGVLFLDELPEFDRRVLEVLREPLESGSITVSRASRQVDFPARFQLIAAMNPCPCGYLGDSSGKCRCTPDQVARYRGRISGPLLDRIDLHVFVPRIERASLTAPGSDAEGSGTVRDRVQGARERQLRRQGKPNSQLGTRELDTVCALAPEARALLEAALNRLALSARAYHRVLKVARSIADLAYAAAIGTAHVAEAVRYRELDRLG